MPDQYTNNLKPTDSYINVSTVHFRLKTPNFSLPKLFLLILSTLLSIACAQLHSKTPNTNQLVAQSNLSKTPINTEPTAIQQKKPENALRTKHTEHTKPTKNAETLSAETLFDLIIAEMAGKQNRLEITLGNYIKQAHITNDPAVIARAARIAKYMNAHQATMDVAKLWLSIDPNNIEALQTITIQLIRVGHFEKAIEQMDKLLAQNAPANFDFLVHHSRELSIKRRAKVIKTIDDLIKKYPRNPQLWFTKALLEHQSKHYEQSLKAANICLDIDKKYVSAIIFKAQLLNEKGQAESSRKLLKKATRKNPNHKRLGIVYARVLTEQNKLNAAQTQFSKLVEKFPEDTDLLLSLALISWENKLAEQAKTYLFSLIERKQKSDEAYTYLAQIANSEKKTMQAIEYYKKVSLGPQFLNAQIQIAKLYAQTQQLDAARATLAGARNLQPQQAVQFYISEGDLLLTAEQYTQALEVFETALSEFPNNPNLLYSRAMLADKMGSLELMESDLRAILEQNPLSALALNALGYTLANRTNRYQEALELIQQAIAIEPNDPAIIDSLGWVYYKMGDLSTALQHLQKAYNLLKDHEIAAHLSEVLWKSGYPDQAKRIWQDALEQNPDSVILKETMERLKTQTP